VAVVTIGLAQILNGLSIVIPTAWSNGNNQGTFTTPFATKFTISPVVFNGNYVLAIILVPIVLGLLVWFLRYTNYGVAIRGGGRQRGPGPSCSVCQSSGCPPSCGRSLACCPALAVLLRVPILGFESFSSVSRRGPSICSSRP